MENGFSKNILHVCSSRAGREMEKCVLLLVKGMADRGGANSIAAPGSSWLLEQAARQGLKTCAVTVRGAFDLFGVFRLWRFVRKEKIAVLHAHQEKVFLSCIIIKLLRGAKLKVVFHRYAERSSLSFAGYRYRMADRVICVSKAAAWAAREQDGVPQEKIRVVYPGIALSRFNPAVPSEEVCALFGLEGKFVVGMVAGMEPPDGKGQPYLLEAAQILKQRFPQACHLFVGTGPLLDKMKALAKKLRVEDKVIFAGAQEEEEKYIAAMHAVCFLSSDTEGFAPALVEAQAMGKPVIGTTVGGIPEAMEDRETGLLVPPRDSELLAQTIIELLEDRKSRKEMEEAAVRFATEHFDIDQTVENVIKIYREMCSPEE
jgi:glycosyltransferase involved in cell wall biosynthesis